MPPRKAPSSSASSLSSRSSRSKTKAAKENAATTVVVATTAAAAPAVTSKVSAELSKPTKRKRKRGLTVTTAATTTITTTDNNENNDNKMMSSSGEDIEMAPPPSTSKHKKSRRNPRPPKVRRKVRSNSGEKVRVGTNIVSNTWNAKTCLEWFDKYSDQGVIAGKELFTWLKELGVSFEGVIWSVLAWKCEAAVEFTISKEEFLKGMRKINVDSNAKLLAKLPAILKDTYPTFTNTNFVSFYRFCFEHYKVQTARNMGTANAALILEIILDSARYSLDWQLPTDDEMDRDEQQTKELKGKTTGIFPHRKAFVLFLTQDPMPVQGITRDQWWQFLPFNRDIPWSLEGYVDEQSTWPSLFDAYIQWKRKEYTEL